MICEVFFTSESSGKNIKINFSSDYFSVEGNFPNSMENYVLYLGYFSISFEKITFYTEILTRKVELWIFSLVSLVKKKSQNNFSCQNYSVENNTIYRLTF